MMKIGDVTGKSSAYTDAAGRDGKKVRDSRNDDFQSRLVRSEGDCREERIRNLAEMIMKQGSKLAEKTDIRELKIYKQMIADFLQEAVHSSLEFSKESFLDRRGRYRVNAVVKKINEELDKLTEDVLKNEKGNIGILQRLTDIRGLVLDILL